MGTLKNKNTSSQNNRLLAYLKEHREGITTYQAFAILGIHRISARIKDLRDMGYPISTIMHREVDREGVLKIWGQYILVA